MKIVADENIDANLIIELRKNGFEIYSIREQNFGITDKEVLQLSNTLDALLMTEDADFGKLINVQS